MQRLFMNHGRRSQRCPTFPKQVPVGCVNVRIIWRSQNQGQVVFAPALPQREMNRERHVGGKLGDYERVHHAGDVDKALGSRLDLLADDEGRAVGAGRPDDRQSRLFQRRTTLPLTKKHARATVRRFAGSNARGHRPGIFCLRVQYWMTLRYFWRKWLARP